MSDGDVVIVCGLGHLREEGRTRRFPWLFSQQSLTEKGQKRKEGREDLGGRKRRQGKGHAPLACKEAVCSPTFFVSLASLLVGSVLAFFTCWVSQKILNITYSYAECEKQQLLNKFDACISSQKLAAD